MINVSEDIQSVTAFKRNTNGMMKRLRKTGRPLVLTVKGKAEMVVLDPATYQHVAEHLDTIACIRRGLEQAKKGLGRPLDEVFDELEREL
jgi:PHD/YefM family antitoxin component YafN of YafNO toxin-antitoxin module